MRSSLSDSSATNRSASSRKAIRLPVRRRGLGKGTYQELLDVGRPCRGRLTRAAVPFGK